MVVPHAVMPVLARGLVMWLSTAVGLAAIMQRMSLVEQHGDSQADHTSGAGRYQATQGCCGPTYGWKLQVHLTTWYLPQLGAHVFTASLAGHTEQPEMRQPLVGCG